MSDQEPLPPNVVALLDFERQRPDVSEDRRSRAERRLELALAMTLAGGGVVAATRVASGATGSSVTAAPDAAPSLVGRLRAVVAARPIASVVVSVAIGAGTGAAGHAVVRPSPRSVAPPTSEIAPPSSAIAPVTASITAERPPALPSVAAPLPTVATTRSFITGAPSNPPARGPSLAAERLLLEAGRTALARGDGASALVALDRHANKFPSGELAEEREALAVQALVAGGRRSDAQVRAARFHGQYPDSILGAAVDAALENTP